MIVSVVVPVTGLIVLLLCLIVIRRYRKNRRQIAITKQPSNTSVTQLYVDPKAELEDEERRRHELEAGGTRNEMEGGDTIFEMPDDRNAGMRVASIDGFHELGGVENSKELEAPGNT